MFWREISETVSNPGRQRHSTLRRANGARGFTLIELVVVVAIVLVISAMAAPVARNTIRAYRLNTAATAVSSVIQSTRYQAVNIGCNYTVAFQTSTQTYQVQTQNITGTPPACATSYSNVGGAIPWASTKEITISANTTLLFQPNGTVSASTGAMTFDVQLGNLKKSFTVSGVGNVSVVSH
jgi:type IV fimbrial biogenesis protein FimT